MHKMPKVYAWVSMTYELRPCAEVAISGVDILWRLDLEIKLLKSL